MWTGGSCSLAGLRLVLCERIIKCYLRYVLLRCSEYTNSRRQAERIVFYTFVTVCALAERLENIWQLRRLIDEMVDVIGRDVMREAAQVEARGRADRTELLLADERVRKVAKAMNMLDGFGREVLVLCHIEMMSRKQLSQIYGKGVCDIRLAIDRAEGRLAEYLEKVGVFFAEDVCLWLAELGEVLALEGRGLVTACVLHYAAEQGGSYLRLKGGFGYWILN